MKKVLSLVALIIATTIASFSPLAMLPAHAEYDACTIVGVDTHGICDPRKEEDLLERIREALNVVFGLAGIICVVVIVYAGINYMTALGDSGKTKNAINAIKYALVGLAVTLFSYVIVGFILNAIGG